MERTFKTKITRRAILDFLNERREEASYRVKVGYRGDESDFSGFDLQRYQANNHNPDHLPGR